VDTICRVYHQRPSDILDPYFELNSWERIYLDMLVLTSGLESENNEDEDFKQVVRNEIVYR
jgi:hypothetical protein